MDPVHERGSMDPVHESAPWTQSKVGVHVLSSPIKILQNKKKKNCLGAEYFPRLM